SRSVGWHKPRQSVTGPDDNASHNRAIEADDPSPVLVTPPEPLARQKSKVVRQESKLARQESKVVQPNKPVKPEKPKQPVHARRVSSMVLQVESVLVTKTGHLKDDYTIGRKLGHGQFGTTFHCTEKASGKEYASKSIEKRKLNQLPPVGHAIHVILYQTIHVLGDLILGRDGFALPEIWDPYIWFCSTLRHCIGSVEVFGKRSIDSFLIVERQIAMLFVCNLVMLCLPNWITKSNCLKQAEFLGRFGSSNEANAMEPTLLRLYFVNNAMTHSIQFRFC
ncbi:Calcium-dependent protein kinase 2-like protein, partial [Drosera capensis]